MRRGWLRPAGWTLATAAMIGLSWYGVHTVLTDPDVPVAAGAPAPPPVGTTPYDDAPAPPSSAPPTASASATPVPSATATASPSRPPLPPTPPPAPHTSRPGVPSPTAGAGRHAYTVDGGTVVLDLGPSSAALVSRTPRPGWSVRVWRNTGMLRVDFTEPGHDSAVVCWWSGHPPQVRTYDT